MADDVVYTSSRLALTDGTIIADLAEQNPSTKLGTVEGMAHQPGLARWHQKLAQSRKGGSGALSANLIIIGDSRVRSSASKYRNAWPDLLRRRLNGSAPAGYGLLPASEGTFNGVLDADWPGGDNPWTYAGAVSTQIGFGLGFHGVSVPSGGGAATLTYFGDQIALVYVRTADGPTAATVTLDGTSVGPLNARGTQTPGLAVTYGTNGAYGFHTLVVTPNDGPLVLEGAQWYDGEVPFFIIGTVEILDGSHAGFGAKDWNTGNTDWSAMLAGGDNFAGLGIAVLGANDIGAGRTPAQFRADMVSLVGQIDTRLASTTMGWLFCTLPGSGTNDVPYMEALYAARRDLGVNRVSVFDMAALRPGRIWGSDLSADNSHPSDAGHVWIAERLAEILDPAPVALPSTPKSFTIHAGTPAEGRLAWTAAIAPIAGTALTYDEATASALRERRHRVWLDAGTYQAVLTAEHATGRGILEVLIGNWPAAAANTPTLTSCGTVDTSTPAGPAVTTTVLGTSVTTAVSGYAPVVIRKTNQANVGRFVQLVLNKTA